MGSSSRLLLIVGLLSPLCVVSAFQIPISTTTRKNKNNWLSIHHHHSSTKNIVHEEDVVDDNNEMSTIISRRSAIDTTISATLTTVVASLGILPPNTAQAVTSNPSASTSEKDFLQSYEDFTSTSEGWQYKDVKIGKDIGGGDIKDGDRVVFDWSGYTIGYFGRPFEAKGYVFFVFFVIVSTCLYSMQILYTPYYLSYMMHGVSKMIQYIQKASAIIMCWGHIFLCIYKIFCNMNI